MSDYTCPKCGSKQALCSVFVGGSEWDDYPYEEGKKESVLYKDGRLNEEPGIFLNICMVVCPDCNYSEWLSIEESNYEIQSVCNHTIQDSEPWIKVKDRSPEKKNKRYLCYDENNGIQQVIEWYYDFKNKSWDWLDDYFNPSHWVELPKSPEVKK